MAGTNQPFKTIQTDDQDLRRVQANISEAFNNLSGSSSVTVVSSISYPIKNSDEILSFNTLQISGVSSTNPINLILPDAVKYNGFSFSWKKTDTSSNLISFVSNGQTRLGQPQLIEGSASPYQTSVSLAKGRFFSDGNNWWLL